jgi:hypothetical protein
MKYRCGFRYLLLTTGPKLTHKHNKTAPIDKMKCCYQTCIVTLPITQLTFHTMSYIPRLPETCPMEGEGIVIIHESLGYKTVWYPNGIVVRYEANGWKRTWWPKPTLESIMKEKNTSTSVQFHASGEVTGTYSDGNFYWGPDYEATPSIAEDGHIKVLRKCQTHGVCFEDTCRLSETLMKVL